MSLLAMLVLVLLGSGALMLAFHLAFQSQSTNDIKIHRSKSRVAAKKLRNTVAMNALMSGLVVLLLPQILHPVMFREDAGSVVTIAVEIGEALVLYDILYYLMHRFPFHQWKFLHRIHTVHHAAKHPTAVESLYMHPVENLAGLGLLFVCTWLAGPVSHVSFAVLVFVYSYLNIVIHCGLNLRSWWLAPFGFMARKHDRHHKHMKAGNYASVTPIPDILFGTYE